MKKVLGLVLASTLLAGCASNTTKSSSDTLTVGTEGTFAPFSYHNDSNTLTGYDVDAIKLIGEKAGYKVVFKEAKWDALIAGLDAKQYDVVVNEVTVTPERKQKYLFAKTITYSHPAVFTKAENKNKVKSFKDLKGKKFSQTGTSNYSALVKQYGGEIVATNDWNENVTLVQQGRTFGTVNDTLTYLDYKNKKPDSDLEIAYQGTEVYEQAPILRKDSKEIQEKLNKAYDEVKKDGSLKKLSIKYFTKDVTNK